MTIITGDNGDNSLSGTSGDDRIEGLGGRDFLSGREGSDELFGGDGDDSLYGDSGDDLLFGGAGADFLYLSDGNDRGEGGEGNDRIDSSEGSDILNGDDGDDYLSARRWGSAADIIVMNGGAGNDQAFILMHGPGNFTFNGGEGNDRIEIGSSMGTHLLTLGSGTDTLAVEGGYSSEAPRSITVTDFATGDDGDRLDLTRFLLLSVGNWDHNQNPFGSGHLRLAQYGADTILEFDMDGAASAYGYVTLVTFQNTSKAGFTYLNLDGFPSDGSVPAGLTLTGTAGADSLTGAAGDDIIDGLAGMDEIYGGSGDDEITGGADDDTLYGEGGADVLIGGYGSDYLDSGYGDDTVHGGEDGDYITSSWGGSEFLYGDGGNDSFYIRRDFGGHDLVTAEGGEGNDALTLYAYGLHTFILNGGTGDDTVRIGWLQGTAEVTLGAGADQLIIEDPSGLLITYGSITVTDFETGPAGDTLDFDVWLTRMLIGWDNTSNPFGTGHLRLMGNGADTLLQIDQDAGGDDYAFRTVFTFENHLSGDFTTYNLDGWASDGSAPVGITLIGTEAGETLTGGAGGDRIEGRGGYDTLRGAAGDDVLIAGNEYAVLEGGSGDDTLFAGSGGGRLDGGAGDDVVTGGIGDELINLGDGADSAHAGGGADTFYFYQAGNPGSVSKGYGEDGDDLFSLRAYNVAHFVANGGNGNDIFGIGAIAGTAKITFGAGADRVYLEGDFFSANLPGTVEITDFTSGAGGDVFDVSVSSAALLTSFDSGSNPFATGHMRLVQSGADTLVQMDRNGGADGYVTVLKLNGVQAATLTAANLGYLVPEIYGTDGADALNGSSGDDRLIAGLGNDVLNGGAGADTMIGGEGDDTYHVDSFADLVTELAGEGTDRVVTALGSATDYSRLYVLPDSVENFTGTSATGQGVRGNALDNDMVTGAGNDLIVLDDGGNDVVASGGGADFFYFGAAWTAADKVDGGAGFDIVGLLGSYNMLLDAGHLTGVERLALYTGLYEPGGTPLSYTITTTDSAVAAGTTLNIIAASLRAEETLVFNGSAEKDARFTITAGAGNDILAGGATYDYLAGGAGKDSLYGLSGNDTLYGGLGADLLDGGAGKDYFQYHEAAESTGLNFDTLSRFDASADKIDLPFTVSGWAGRFTGSLSAASFDSDLAKVLDDALFNGSAAMFQANGGDFAGRVFVVVDGNGDGAYTAGQDYLFELASPVMPLSIPPVFA
ncbi:MAG TPA: calcium-binding protein [Allosphingosinicella sp.]|jgi:Ca2+-binding RTX toxin-like protein